MRFLFKTLSVLVIMCSLFSPRIGATHGARKMITLTDVFGKEINVLAPVERMVVTNGDAAEIICALGASKKIIGISDYIGDVCSNLLSDLQGREMVGSTQNPSMEKILELQPDLVIASDRWVSDDAFEAKIGTLGIPIARIPCYRLNRLKEDIRLLGRISGKEEKASEYAAMIENALDGVSERLKKVKVPVRVYSEGYGDYVTSSVGSGAALLLERAGVANIAADQPVPFPRVSAEWVVVQNPDVILKAAGATYVKTGYGITNIKGIASFWDEILNRPGWYHINAVKNHRIFLISSEIWAGPRAPVGILHIAKWCYPELFEDMNPRAFHREWLQKWHHKELKGIYVYPAQ